MTPRAWRFLFLFPWLWAAGFTASRADAAEVPSPATPLTYFILVTGGELLEGAFPDGHTHFLTRTLRPLGVECVGSMIVDDQAEAMQAALGYASRRARLVVVTGGLGPTPNDITRETLAAFTGIALREDPEVLALLERRMGRSRDQLLPNLRRQALVPVRGGYLKNPTGTAVGLVFESAPAMVVALPGPPRELQPMVTGELMPLLQRRFGVQERGPSLTLRFVGLGQSPIAQTLQDQGVVPPEIVVTSWFEGGRVDFTFTAPRRLADGPARLQAVRAAARRHLGAYLYGEDGTTLEDVVLEALARRGRSLVLAEVGTGGALAASLTAARASASLLKGDYGAPSDAALLALVGGERSTADEDPETRVRRIAEAALRLAEAELVVVVGEPVRRGTEPAQCWVGWQRSGEAARVGRAGYRGGNALAQAQMVTETLEAIRRGLGAVAPE